MPKFPSVLEFLDYRDFLNACFAALKKRNKAFSYRAWALKLELSGPARLTTVLGGKANLGPALVEKFVRYFEFSALEEAHFRDLVRLAGSKRDHELRQAIVRKIAGRKSGMGYRMLDKILYEQIAQGYAEILTEMTSLEDFREDPEWISKRMRPRVSPSEVRAMLAQLLTLGVLARDGDGKLKSAGDVRYHSETNDEKAVQSSLGYKVRVALEQLEQPSGEAKGRFLSMALPIRAKDLDRARQMINAFWNEFGDSIESIPGDEVYLLNLQFVPLTKNQK